VLADALKAVDKGERVYKAELHRLMGELLQSQSGRPGGEAHFVQALEIARHQDAKWRELRAAASLARFWRDQGRRPEAHDLLAPVYVSTAERKCIGVAAQRCISPEKALLMKAMRVEQILGPVSKRTAQPLGDRYVEPLLGALEQLSWHVAREQVPQDQLAAVGVWQEHLTGRHSHAFLLWSLLMFQAWYDVWGKSDHTTGMVAAA
jgi:hypothetical protein